MIIISIFCKVIDNFGDIGVCWRLAQNLAFDDINYNINLYIDDLKSLYYIAQNDIFLNPSITNSKIILNNINVIYWENNDINYDNASYVINAFACKLPEKYQNDMPANVKWIQLDYLATEEWANEYHGLHAFIGQHKRIFFTPGFTSRTGGLITRDFIKINAADKQNLCEKYKINYFGLDQKNINIFIFAYINHKVTQVIQDLYNTCLNLDYKLNIYMPDSVYNVFIEYVNKNNIKFTYKINILKACSQSDFDNILQLFDILWVRGEDSFIRAQLTSIPMIWQAYTQSNNVHLDKVNGFLTNYLEFFQAEHKYIIKNLWLNINDINGNVDNFDTHVWEKFILILNNKNFRNSLENWSDYLKKLPKLTQELIKA